MLKTEIVIDDAMRSEIKKSPKEISQLIKDLENNEDVGMFLSILSSYYLSTDDVFCAWRSCLITDEQIYDFVKEIKKEITKMKQNM